MKLQAALDARALRLRARRDVSTLPAGAYRSAFRGRGLTFEELRDYRPGDEVRWMEWNATARLGRPIVKRMREERDLVLGLLLDVSDSLDFGAQGDGKRAALRRAAAALAMAAVSSQDRVALATFGDGVHSLSPAGGPLQLERIFQLLVVPSPGGATAAHAALDWAARTLPRHTVLVLLSDLLFPDPGAPLRWCARKHELVVLRMADPADDPPARMAPVRIISAEEAARGHLRRGRRGAPPRLGRPLDTRLLVSLGAEVGTLRTGSGLLPSLQRFFEERVRSVA